MAQEATRGLQVEVILGGIGGYDGAMFYWVDRMGIARFLNQ